MLIGSTILYMINMNKMSRTKCGKKVTGVFALAVVATLAVTGSAARTSTAYDGPFTFSSTLSAPAPNYTIYYTSSISPANMGGSYNHQGTLYTSSGTKGIGGANPFYSNSTAGITKAVDHMAWYSSSQGSYGGTTTVTW